MDGVPGRGESRVRLEIDLAGIAANFRAIRAHVAPCRVMAVLKANAYGLGGRPVAELLRGAGADVFGTAELNEALELVPLGVPVQILGNLLPEEVAPAVAAGIIVPVTDWEMAQLIDRTAERLGVPVQGHMLVDTGMGRLGTMAADAAGVIRKIAGLRHLKLTGAYSHFPVAYAQNDDFTRRQIAAFHRIIAELAAEGIVFETVHMAASDAISNFPEASRPPCNQVRAGINLYGYYDPEVRHAMELTGVLELKTRLAGVRTLPAGYTLGYGRTHRLLVNTRVGTIAAGYADGLPLALSNRGYVLVRGQLCPVLGRISMDYTTVSLENVPDATWGDEVVCLGRQGENEITMNHWAQLKGTHAYDILCAFGSRVKRIYKG